AGAEAVVGVVELEPHRGRPRSRVENRRDQGDASREHRAGPGWDRRLDRTADLDAPELVLEDLGIDPDAAQVGDLEEDGSLRDVMALVDVLPDDVPVDRREYG